MARPRTGTLFQRKRGGMLLWHAQITVEEGGEKKRPIFNLETEDRGLARRKMQRLVRSLDKKPETETPTTIDEAKALAKAPETLADYFSLWQERYPVKSASDDKQRFRDYVPDHIKSMCLVDVRKLHVEACIQEVREQGRSDETARKVRTLLHRVFKRAWKDELIRENPVAKTDAPKGKSKKRRVVMSNEELALACTDAKTPEKVRMIWLTQRFTGMRSGDACSLLWEDIQWATGEIMVPNDKTGEHRPIVMHPLLSEMLRRWHVKAGEPTSGLVYPARGGERYAKRGTSFARQLRRALKAQGVTRPELFTATERTLPVDDHSIRRLFATSLADSGVNLQRAMALTGHSSRETHERYIRNTRQMREVPSESVASFSDGLRNSERQLPAAVLKKANDVGGVDGTRTRGLRRDSAKGSLDHERTEISDDHRSTHSHEDGARRPSAEHPELQQAQRTRNGALRASLVLCED